MLLAHFFLGFFHITLKPRDLAGELIVQLPDFHNVTSAFRLVEQALQENFPFRNFCAKLLVDFSDFGPLLVGHFEYGVVALEAFHGEFVGGFHGMNVPNGRVIARDSASAAPRLLCFDFDGTMVCNRSERPVSRELLDELAHWLAGGVTWLINTGRRLPELQDGLARRGVECTPHFVVVEETGLFECRSRTEWHPVGDWNERRDDALRALKARAGAALRAIRRHVTGAAGSVYLEGHLVDEILARSEEDMEAIVAVIEEIRLEHGLLELGYQRNTIYLRFGHMDFHKGSALAALARHLSISPAEILVAGDNHNDLSMLQRSVAHHLICPSNALPLVQKTIWEHGGTVANRPHGEGLADGLRKIRLRRR